MRRMMMAAMVAVWGSAAGLPAQTHTPGMRHTPGMHGASGDAAPAASPAMAGQAAYAAIAEVVRLLEADPATDWSAVNLEALRMHLVDMNAVTLHARVSQAPVPGGARMEVTGDGATADAIRRMATAHAAQLEAAPEYRARVEEIAGGVRLTVTAERSGDARTEAKIRGLGFIGLLTHGDHHGPHHLMMAKGGHAH